MIIFPRCPDATASKILQAKETMFMRSLTYDFNNLKENVTPCQTVSARPGPKDRMTQCLDLMTYIMEKEDRKFYQGVIVGKPIGSRSSYTMETSVRDYLNRLCKTPEYSSVITSQLNNVVAFLAANPMYGGLKHIEKDLNLIEVRALLLSSLKVYKCTQIVRAYKNLLNGINVFYIFRLEMVGFSI
jgi:hypothetical protein